MSVAATNWVWTQSMAEGADRLVLLALADFADETGKCFGSWGTMQRKTRLARSTIARSIKRLEAAGELTEIEPAKTFNGRNMATVWQLPVGRCQNETGPILTLPPSDSDITPGVILTLPPSDSDTPTIVNVKETRKNVSSAAPAPATASPSPPSSPSANVPPDSINPPKPKKTPKLEVAESELQLPHGAGFRRAWLQFMEHRRHPIRGKRVPLTKRAAELVLEDMAKINEQQACEAINMAIKTAWIVPYIDKYLQDSVKVAAPVVRTGPIQPSEAERRMLALEALQAQQMKGAA